MEKNGYIEKKQDEKDSRKSRIYFTEKGRSICEDGHKKFVMIQEKLQEYFTKEEQEELKRLLNKFCDCLDEQTEILKKERKEKGRSEEKKKKEKLRIRRGCIMRK